MTKPIKQLAESFYELVNNEGDLSEVLAEDFVFGIMPGFPYGGYKNGLAASLDFFEKLGQHFDFWEVVPLRYIGVDDSNLVVTALYRTKATETGRNVEMETVHLWTSKAGMLNTYKHYCDTAILSAALDHKVPQ
jgi:ketosteroid isomerase-like protein